MHESVSCYYMRFPPEGVRIEERGSRVLWCGGGIRVDIAKDELFEFLEKHDLVRTKRYCYFWEFVLVMEEKAFGVPSEVAGPYGLSYWLVGNATGGL